MGRASTWKWAALMALGLISSAPASGLGAPAAAPAPPPAAKPASGASASNLPYDITADQSDLFNEERRQVYKGNVDVIQGADRLRTPQLTVFFAKKDPNLAPVKAAPAPGSAASTFGKVERMEAEGPVYYITPTQNAKGDHGTYLASDDTITLTGNVVLVQDKNVGNGDKLVIEKSTGHATLYSGASSKRVRGVFYQESSPAAPKSGPSKAAAKSSGSKAP